MQRRARSSEVKVRWKDFLHRIVEVVPDKYLMKSLRKQVIPIKQYSITCTLWKNQWKTMVRFHKLIENQMLRQSSICSSLPFKVRKSESLIGNKKWTFYDNPKRQQLSSSETPAITTKSKIRGKKILRVYAREWKEMFIMNYWTLVKLHRFGYPLRSNYSSLISQKL